MTVPARRPVDDALDRLRQQINKSRATYVPGTPEKYPATELRGLTVLEAEALLAQAEQLREELDEYAERLAWHREERDAYLKGNLWVTRAAEEQSRAEAAEAENRRLTEGLREAETGFNDISLILEAENDGYQERAYKRAMEEWRHVRALIAANPPQGDAAAGSSPSDGEPCPFCGFQGPFDGHVCEPVLCGCGDPDNCRYATAEEHADSPSGGGGAK